jgi:hypothetical protein
LENSRLSSDSAPNTPCADQTPEDIERWLREYAKVGAEIVIRETQFGLLSYRRAVVVRVGKGRFEMAPVRRDGTHDESGDTFYYSGKNCWHPKGQTRLVIPTEGVLGACNDCDANGGHLPGVPWSFTTSF